MDTLENQQLSVLEINNGLKDFEAYINDQRTLKTLTAEDHKLCEEIKALLKDMNLYTEEKCKLEKGVMQSKCKKMQIQKECEALYKIIDEDKKRQSELQITIQQEEKKKIELLKKYEAMMREKSQRLRDSHKYYKKENVEKELATMKEESEELLEKENQARNVVDELQRDMDEIRPSVPYDILNSIMGKDANDD